MMKIIYLAFQSIKKSMMGVMEKIENQTIAGRYLHSDFYCFVIGNHDQDLLQNRTFSEHLNIAPINYSQKRISSLFHLRKQGMEIADRIILREKPNILYLRYPLACPLFLKFLKGISSRGIKIITEHQSMEFHELIELKKYHLAISEALFGSRCLRHVHGIVGVTEEIARYEQKRTNTNQNMVCIPNGINTSKYPLRTPHTADPHERLDALFIGSISSWHGLDRLLQGMTNDKNFFLHIIGEGEQEKALKTLACSLNIEKNVSFYGFRNKDEVSHLYDTCHFAVASLGIFRKRLSQASPLKTREYAARGIPFVSGYTDPDFPSSLPWILQVSNDSTVIDTTKIRKWFYSQAYTIESNKIRDYAEKKLSYSVKMRRLLEFCASIR